MMKTWTSLVVVVGLVSFVGCKKQQDEAMKAPEPSSATKPVEPAQPTAAKPVEPAQPAAAKPLDGAELAAVYQRCVAQINANQLQEFRKACIADDYVGHAVAGNPELEGGDALVSWMKDMKTAMPDWKLQPQIVMVSGRNILAVNLMSGTHTGAMKTPMGELPATNKQVGMLMFHRVAINDENKAKEEWAIADEATLLGQLGVAPKGMPPTRSMMEKGLEGAPIILVTADDAKERTNLEVAKRGFDAFSARKLRELMAVYADDAIDADVSMAKDSKGKKAIEKAHAEFSSGFSDGKITDLQMWAAGDYVVAIGKFEGTNDKDRGKLKKTGKQVSLDFGQVARFEDGKAAHVWRFMNGLDAARQLGLVPATSGAAPAGDPKAGDPKAGAGVMKPDPAKQR